MPVMPDRELLAEITGFLYGIAKVYEVAGYYAEDLHKYLYDTKYDEIKANIFFKPPVGEGE